jgi:hypothetical protein
MKATIFEWLDTASTWTLEIVNCTGDVIVEFAQLALDVVAGCIALALAITGVIHLLPLLFVWLAGAPLWVVTALAFGF